MNAQRAPRRLRPWQFSLFQMMGATTLVCLAVSLYRQLSAKSGQGGPLGLIIPALFIISIVSTIMAGVFGVRAVAQGAPWQFSVKSLLALVGVSGIIGLGVSDSYLGH